MKHDLLCIRWRSRRGHELYGAPDVWTHDVGSKLARRRVRSRVAALATHIYIESGGNGLFDAERGSRR